MMVVHKNFERQPHLPCSINLEEYPEARVNAWSIGELHAIDPRIVPNDPIFQRWILAPRVLDPYPFERFIATHPRWEPGTPSLSTPVAFARVPTIFSPCSVSIFITIPLKPPARDVPIYSLTRVPGLRASTLRLLVQPARTNSEGFVTSSATQCSVFPSFVTRSKVIEGCGFRYLNPVTVAHVVQRCLYRRRSRFHGVLKAGMPKTRRRAAPNLRS
jgi:hypothetical protein